MAAPLLPLALLPLLLALLCAPAARAQAFAYTYGVCGPPGSGASKSYAAGDTAYVCINFNGAVKGFFNVVVDQFTAISVAGSNTALPEFSGFIQEGVGNVTSISASFNTSETRTFYEVFDVAVQGAFSAYPRIYKRLTYALNSAGDLSADIATFSVFTAIVQVSGGVVQSIGWDDGCFFCATNTPLCDQSAFNANSSSPLPDGSLIGCLQPMSACYPYEFTGGALAGNSSNASATVAAANATLPPQSSCDLKVFIVWAGTDSKGNVLTSVNKRFSRFRQFDVATAYQSALNAESSGLSLASTALTQIESVPGRIGVGTDQTSTGRRLRGGEANWVDLDEEVER